MKISRYKLAILKIFCCFGGCDKHKKLFVKLFINKLLNYSICLETAIKLFDEALNETVKELEKND